MKIRIDDTFKYVDDENSGEAIFHCSSSHGSIIFNKMLQVILSKKQFLDYLINDNRRVFNVSDKKIEMAKNRFPDLKK